jgi:hypothetical protein
MLQVMKNLKNYLTFLPVGKPVSPAFPLCLRVPAWSVVMNGVHHECINFYVKKKKSRKTRPLAYLQLSDKMLKLSVCEELIPEDICHVPFPLLKFLAVIVPR